MTQTNAAVKIAIFAMIATLSFHPSAMAEGSLVIAGGSKLPDSIRAEFIELAGGEGVARIVVIPSASMYADDAAWVEGRLARWRGFGPASVRSLHTRDASEAGKDEFAEPLRHATGVWISGGDQSKLIDTYGGGVVEAELHRLLDRGGVIGGTSAGAAVMSNPMIVGGYPVARVGAGFGFLEDAVVDQHFVARNRIVRLRGVLAGMEDLAGLGVDEGTAAIVQDGTVRVLGDSTVTAIWPQSSSKEGQERTLNQGDTLDLSELR